MTPRALAAWGIVGWLAACGWAGAYLYEELRPTPCVQSIPYEEPTAEKRPDLGAFL